MHLLQTQSAQCCSSMFCSVQVLRRKYFCFLSFYCLLFKNCGDDDDDDAVDDNKYFNDNTEGEWNLAHNVRQLLIVSRFVDFDPNDSVITSTIWAT